LEKNEIGFGQKAALIRFFFKEDIEKLDIDRFCKLWGEAKYLIDIGIYNLKYDFR
jgi:hypothetical protein